MINNNMRYNPCSPYSPCKKNVAFSGLRSKYNKVVGNAFKPIAEGLAKKKPFTDWCDSQKDNLGKINTHSMAGLSLFLSSIYMTQTLRNKELDPQRKKTLAINQGITVSLATIGVYTIDKALFSMFKRFEKRVKEIKKKQKYSTEQLNKLLGEDASNYVCKTAKETKVAKQAEAAGRMIKGVDVARKAIVITLIYRFLGPVIATPTADKITKFAKKQGWMEK